MKLYFALIICLGLLSARALADDTEIYTGSQDQNNIPPNVVFIFDTSGSMRTAADGGTRMELVQKAAVETIADLANINLTLMRFRGDRGGYFSLPMKNVDDDTHRQNLISTINGYSPGGYTPAVETLHEAAQYFRNSSIIYGGNSHNGVKRSNSYYDSPITDQCQKNHIVMFTDGASSYDSGTDSRIRSLANQIPYDERQRLNLSTSCSTNGSNNSCMEELAYYLNNFDLSSDFDDKQTATVHTIGGFISGNAQTILDSAAVAGGGISANAQSYDELKEALSKVFDDISRSAGTFAAPAVSVSSLNTLRQTDEVYYAMFKPEDNIGWSGNLKRYRFNGSGTLVDAENNAAVDDSTGYFKEDIRSFWTPANQTDGNVVKAGGMASRFALPRKVYTNIAGETLTDTNNRVYEGNSQLRQSHFDVSLNTTEFTKLVKWVRGVDITASGSQDVPRLTMEDPLHSRPVVLNYGEAKTVNGREEPDATLFVGTNSGYLHAFDTDINNPKERFAFIPKELLPVAADYYRKAGLKAYGLDGPISVWHNDTNINNIVDDGEKAILYVGMRRGGSSYYALDVSDRDAPKLLWQINGKDHPNTTSGFERLGQSWSKMLPVPVKINGQPKQVVLFGGGYDDAEDDRTQRLDSTVGGAIYMVDALSGQLLWHASADSNADLTLSAMTNGIPSDLVPIDDTGDGTIDLLYAADTGGRVWRIDFNSPYSNDLATGGLIADIGKSGSVRDNVRFFNSPDVVYVKREIVDSSGQIEVIKSYQIALGSGFRAHPLNEEAYDNFYVVYDDNVDGAPKIYTTLNRADLANYRNRENEQDLMKNGFYFTPTYQSTGEKFLTKSITLENNIFVTSYRPTDAASRSGCEADIGKTRMYIIPLGGIDRSNDPDADPTDIIEEETEFEGITDPVLKFFNPDPRDPNCKGDDCIKEPPPPCILIGTVCIDSGIDDGLVETYWLENAQ